MNELYETHFGIHDHFHTVDPLSSVRFNRAEQYLDDALYDGYLTTFLYRDLGRKLGMSFDDFLNRPRHEIIKILSLVEEMDKKKQAVDADTLSALETQRARNDASKQ